MASMTEITCACGCGRKKSVRVADVKRGWGKYFSKSCKARHQESKTGQYKRYLRNKNNFAGSGVDKKTYVQHQQEHGGYPQFSNSGEFEGTSIAMEDLTWGD